VVWLHGIGQDAETMREVAKASGLTGRSLRNVYLQAPFRPIGLGRARPVRAWVHQSVMRLETARWSDLQEVLPPARAVLDRELDRVGEGRVLVAGFSQGATMALILGLGHSRRLAGVAGYAALPPSQLVTGRKGPRVNGDIPLWLGHGKDDWAIPVGIGHRIAERLAAMGHPVQWHEYVAGHEPFSGAQDDLASFVTERLWPDGTKPRAEESEHD
jgi:phospholipase/carboxylesterase